MRQGVNNELQLQLLLSKYFSCNEIALMSRPYYIIIKQTENNYGNEDKVIRLNIFNDQLY